MGQLSDKDKQKITGALEKAALNAGYRMKVRADLGAKLHFSDFVADTGASLALNFVFEQAARELRRRGMKLSFGGGHDTWDKIKPDRFTVIVNGKTVMGGIAWDF